MSDFFRRVQNKSGLVVLLLASLTLVVYASVGNYEFVNVDDDLFVTSNARVREGLTWENVGWAMRSLEVAFWQPLTWLSHMLDCELFGLNPAGHHLMSVLLHVLNVILLFWVLERMTGALWCSAFVAALFALHPLNVESVAWVTERKNVLSTLFWLLTMGAYVGYVRNPGWKRYSVVMGAFVLGLMAKPMLVTLPCVLLLLDYWPLGRLGKDRKELPERLPRLVLEKIPLLVPVAAVSVLAVEAQSKAGALPTFGMLPTGVRVANAVVSYGLYLKKMVWPMDLAVFYPHPGSSVKTWWVVLAAVVLVGISLGVWWRRQSSRYLVVGWLWYLGTLVPVSGLVQVGGHAMADRFAYVPLIGLFIMVTWGAAEIAQSAHLKKQWPVAAGISVVMVLALLTQLQLSHWRNSIALFEHALQSTTNNHLAYSNLGLAFLERESLDEAIYHFYKAIEIAPMFALAHSNLGTALQRKGMLDEALKYSIRALEINPDLPEAHNNLGIVLFRKGRLNEALQHFSRALEIKPDYVPAYYNLGIVMADQNRIKEAIECFRQVLKLDSGHAGARRRLALLSEGR
ncbi:tetratricopeptide repeat protein [Acidobacteria bacterium AH-259-O06]|nr:tetratricopeptide repeat protein [Acidobacteria bacterium AH-259-O06]